MILNLVLAGLLFGLMIWSILIGSWVCAVMGFVVGVINLIAGLMYFL